MKRQARVEKAFKRLTDPEEDETTRVMVNSVGIFRVRWCCSVLLIFFEGQCVMSD